MIERDLAAEAAAPASLRREVCVRPGLPNKCPQKSLLLSDSRAADSISGETTALGSPTLRTLSDPGAWGQVDPGAAPGPPLRSGHPACPLLTGGSNLLRLTMSELDN